MWFTTSNANTLFVVVDNIKRGHRDIASYYGTCPVVRYSHISGSFDDLSVRNTWRRGTTIIYMKIY